MKKEKAEEGLDVSVAAALAPKMRLREVLFLELHAAYTSAASQGQLTYNIADVSVSWSLEPDGSVLAVFPFRVSIRATDDGEQTSEVCEVGATIRLTYTQTEESAADDLRHFVGISGYMHAWPYLRAEVQNMTAKLGLPPLTLPLVYSGQARQRAKVLAPLILGAPPQGVPRAGSPEKSKKLKKKAGSKTVS